jgi:ABC-type lipoprotein release transport system permease subunit
MNTARRWGSFLVLAYRKFSELGVRTLLGCATALIAAVLIFSAPEIGVVGAFGGVVIGGISAVLVRPQITPVPRSVRKP